jgi:hypothetical protein
MSFRPDGFRPNGLSAKRGKIENTPVYTFCLSVTAITLDRNARSKPNFNCKMYFHEFKAVVENGLDWSAEFPENREKSLFLGRKKISGKFIYRVLRQTIYF